MLSLNQNQQTLKSIQQSGILFNVCWNKFNENFNSLISKL